MGFLTKLINALTDDTFIENKESINIDKLDQSITLRLQTMKNELLIAKETFPSEAEKIEKQIQLLEDSILQEETSSSLEESYQTLQQAFIPLKAKSQRKAVLNEVALFQKELDSLFFGNADNPRPITDKSLNEAENKLKLLVEKKSLFSKEQANLYLTQLTKLEYRLSCCQLIKDDLMNDSFYAPSSNVFAHLSEDKKKIYGEFIKQDFYQVQTTLMEIASKYQRYEIEKDLSVLNGYVDNLAESFSQDFLEDFLTDHIFDNDDAISTFGSLCAAVHREKLQLAESIDKHQTLENQKRRQQEEQEKLNEKLKTISVEEIKQELKQIDNNHFDITQSYQAILNYELNIAKVQGLLSPINCLQVSDMEITRICEEDIGVVIENALNSGINYRILRNIDNENKKGRNCLLVTTTNQTKKLLSSKDSLFSRNYLSQQLKGHISNAFATYCKQHLPESRSLVFDNQQLYSISGNPQTKAKKELLTTYAQWQKEVNDPKNISNVACALTIPYLRPLIPILKKLQEAGIDYYFPPIDDQTQKQQATKKIYIDRKNLPLYQEKVHPELSTNELGEIIVENETIDFEKLIWQDTDIPLIQAENEKKSYAALTESQIRKVIKQLDDKSHDCTTSYQDILAYEKKIARAKGLLTDKEEVNTDDVELYRCSKDNLWRFIKAAQENVLRCSFFPEVDDNPDQSVIVAITKGKKNVFNLPNLQDSFPNCSKLTIPGIYGKSFYEYFKHSIPSSYENQIYYQGKNISIRDNSHNTIGSHMQITEFQNMIKTVHQKIENLPTHSQDIEDIKVALECSYLRPIVPILEKLKEAGINYYLPPVDNKTIKYNPTKQIYIDRKDLDLYKKQIHPEISTAQKGIIKLKGESITTASLLCQGTEIPFLEEKEKSKE